MLTKEQRERFEKLGIRIQCEYDTEQARFDFEDCVEKISDDDDAMYRLVNTDSISDEDFVLSDFIDEKKLACESFDKLQEIAQDAADTNIEKLMYDTEFEQVMDDIVNNLVLNEKTFETLKPYFNTPIELYETCGYCQGDYAYVLLFDDDVTDEKRNSKTKEWVNHLFWDAPIYCRLVFENDENAIGCEYIACVDDPYDYDREKYIDDFVDQVKGEFPDIEAFREYLEEIMPEEPAYS